MHKSCRSPMHFHLKWKSVHYLVIYALMTHPEDLCMGYEKWFVAFKVIFLLKSSIIVSLKRSESQLCSVRIYLDYFRLQLISVRYVNHVSVGTGLCSLLLPPATCVCVEVCVLQDMLGWITSVTIPEKTSLIIFQFCFKMQNNFQKQTKIKSLWDFLKLWRCSLCFLLFCVCAWALVSRVWHRENERERFIHLVGWFLDVPMVIKQDVVSDLLPRQAWVLTDMFTCGCLPVAPCLLCQIN